jgi:hypothetical protein
MPRLSDGFKEMFANDAPPHTASVPPAALHLTTLVASSPGKYVKPVPVMRAALPTKTILALSDDIEIVLLNPYAARPKLMLIPKDVNVHRIHRPKLILGRPGNNN